MKQWWLGLQASERRTLSIGGIVLGISLLYFGLWEPFQNKVDVLENSVATNQSLSVWMDKSAAEVIRLRGTGSSPSAIKDNRSLLSLVDQTAKRGGLGQAVKRVEPDGQEAVRVWLEQASFDDMMRWLLKIEQSNGITVKSITIDRQEQQGRVNARLSLQGAGA